MRILVAGVCGFVGSALARAWAEAGGHSFVGIDSLARPGSEVNRLALRELGVDVRHADLRAASDVESLPDVDAVVDAAASPSVLGGVDGSVSSRQLVEHNLLGTVNLLEVWRRCRAAFVLLSTSRVYSLRLLAGLPHEIVAVDDGSTDATWSLLQELARRMPELAPTQNPGPHGIARAIIHGLDRANGDAVAIMMERVAGG